MKLLPDWRDILKKAWSIRLILLACVLSGMEVAGPYIFAGLPNGLFAGLSALTTAAAFGARLLAQKHG
jgi:hypothetical protein